MQKLKLDFFSDFFIKETGLNPKHKDLFKQVLCLYAEIVQLAHPDVAIEFCDYIQNQEDKTLHKYKNLGKFIDELDSRTALTEQNEEALKTTIDEIITQNIRQVPELGYSCKSDQISYMVARHIALLLDANYWLEP